MTSTYFDFLDKLEIAKWNEYQKRFETDGFTGVYCEIKCNIQNGRLTDAEYKALKEHSNAIKELIAKYGKMEKATKENENGMKLK